MNLASNWSYSIWKFNVNKISVYLLGFPWKWRKLFNEWVTQILYYTVISFTLIRFSRCKCYNLNNSERDKSVIAYQMSLFVTRSLLHKRVLTFKIGESINSSQNFENYTPWNFQRTMWTLALLNLFITQTNTYMYGVSTHICSETDCISIGAKKYSTNEL